MKQYRVYGTTTVTVSTVVEVADDENLTEEEICERAACEFQGVASFCGNGGFDKLIGVCGSDDTIDTGGDVEFSEFGIVEENRHES